MARYPVVKRTVQGTEVSHEEFKRKIREIVETADHALTINEIAESLGDDHGTPEGLTRLRKDLTLLVGRNALARPSRALYGPNPEAKTRGVSKNDESEIFVLKTIREHGGIMRSSELIWELYTETAIRYRHRDRTRVLYYNKTSMQQVSIGPCEDWVNSSVNGQTRRSLKSLVRQGRLTRHFSSYPGTIDEKGKRRDGYYSLPEGELQTLVKTTRNVSHMMGFSDLDKVSQDILVDLHCQAVGNAFKAVRVSKRLTIPDMIADPAIRKSMKLWMKDCAIEVEWHRGEWADFLANGGSGSRRQMDEEILALLYQDFEDYLPFEQAQYWSRRTHWCAEPPFFHAVAAKLKVDAVELSRGYVVPIFPPDYRTEDDPILEEEEEMADEIE